MTVPSSDSSESPKDPVQNLAESSEPSAADAPAEAAPPPTDPPATDSPDSAMEAPPPLDSITSEEIEAMTREATHAADTTPKRKKDDGVRKGRIVHVDAEDAHVDLEDGTRGTVPLIEFAQEAPPAIGQEIHVIIARLAPAGGIGVFSKRKADRARAWQRLNRKDIVEARVTAMNKGGLEVDLGGVRGFMPASQCDTRRMKDISILLNQTVPCEIVQINRAKNEIIVSRRNAIIRMREQERMTALQDLQEGQIRKGVVRNLTEYGAFVSVGGVDGLLHVSDMSWGRVRKASDVVAPGQELDVVILRVDHDKGKVALGLKQAIANPWDDAETKFPVGARVRGRVTRLANFGAFVEVAPNLEALVPLSEMSWSRQVHRPADLVQEGQEIEAVVLSVDPQKHRLSLGMKQTEDDPWAAIEAKFPKDGMISGTVTRVTTFGAFVELEPGLEGLVHISEMADRRINDPHEVVEEGKTVEVRVLNIDMERRRISLSLRPASARSEPTRGEAESRDKAKKRKKPLRGGLSSHWNW